MKIVHFADLHLDAAFASRGAAGEAARRRRQALRDVLLAIARLTRDEQADALFCGGDLYERERVTPDTAAFLRQTFASLDPIRVYIAPGNHDYHGPDSVYATQEWSPNVHIFKEPRFRSTPLADGVTLWGAAHCAPANTPNFLEGFRTEGAGTHIALLHGSERSWLSEQGDGKEPHAPFDAEDIEQAGFHHAFLGHYHRPKDAPRHTYPGNPDPLEFGEDGKRGAVIATVNADAALAGRDYSSEIIIDGAPDGSAWLGLNRRVFSSVACVRQADMLGILQDPVVLQGHLQRAAATAGADETAARALSLLDSYRRDEVGSNRAPTKPLLQTKARFDRARSDLSKAKDAHESYMQRRADVEVREQEAQRIRRQADAVEAVFAEEDAVRAERQIERIRELDGKFPEGAPRPSPERDEVAEQVTAALTQWEQRPELIEPDGDTVEEQGRKTAEAAARLGAAKAAAAEQEAQDAGRRLKRVRELTASFPDGQPPRPSVDDHETTLQASIALREWGGSEGVLPAEPSGASVEEIEQELADFAANAAPTPPSSRMLPLAALVLAVGAGAIGIGVAAIAADFRAWGVAVAATGIVGAVGALRWHTAARSSDQARAAREQAVLNATKNGIIQRLDARRKEESAYQDEIERREAALNGLAEAARDCGVAAMEPSEQAQALRDWLAVRGETLRKNDELGALWDELQQLLGERSLDDIETEEDRLRQEAASRIDSADPELLGEARNRNLVGERLDEFERETQENLIAWERERAERKSADERYQAACRQVESAEDALRNAAVAAQVVADDADGLAEALRKWQERRKQSIAEAEERSKDWDELQQLLGENSLEDVAAEAGRLRADANERATEVGASALAQAKSMAPSPALLESLQSEARDAQNALNVERGQLTELQKSLPSVADAEDDLDEAEREMERVRRLSETLDKTVEFLRTAQDRVHRNIAPILRKTVLEWLTEVTGGRYADCRIDPANLKVEVAGASGRWRDAALLSHGTAEQVYLLLRLALARHLTADSGEACPLILDDAVGASDGERKLAALDALLAISESTQVILFTHEDDVRDWARERLVGPARRLLELDPSGVPA